MSNVKMHPVKSGQIKSVGYDAETRSLYIEFINGTVYRYRDVPENKFVTLAAPTNPSVGSYFALEIKAGGYKYEKIEQKVISGGLEI